MSTVTQLQWHYDFLCGSISGVANCLSGYVFDTLKVKLQMNPNSSMLGYLRKMISDGTILKLYDGMYYPLVTVPIVNAIVFGSYQFYKKITGKTNLSLLDGIENGAFAGLANTFVVGPVELIKCRMQLDTNQFKNSRQCLKATIKQEGVRGLFRGTFATMARQVPAYAAQFAAYQILKDMLTDSPDQALSFVEGCFVGAVAGISCWLFSYPQDIIKTKIQVNELGRYPRHRFIPDGGFLSCGREIMRESGLRGFFYGIQPCLVRAVVANAFGIGAYERSKHFFKHQDIL